MFWQVDVDVGSFRNEPVIETVTFKADSLDTAKRKAWDYGSPMADPERVEEV